MLDDYNELVEKMQRELAQRYFLSPDLFNEPGRSLACKIDPFYYLAVRPAFMERMGKWLKLEPAKVEEALIRTGNMVTCSENRQLLLKTIVLWNEGASRTAIDACLLDADFVDRALILYAGAEESLPVSDLKIAASERSKMERFLAGKTFIQGLAFG
jgi:hypothetical protein